MDSRMRGKEDNVCMVLDLEGFFVEQTFQVRELGYFTWQGDFGRNAFYMKTEWRHLHPKDRKTVSYVKYNVHGLTYQPRKEEQAYEYDQVEEIVKDLYASCQTSDKFVVAYKGGHVEKDLLQRLNIPSFNLEKVGCPKYEVLKETIVEPLPSCGFHINASSHHCPMTECHAFYLWYCSNKDV